MRGEKGLGQLLGEHLKQIRREQDLGQEDVARRANTVGLPWSRETVQAFENGGRKSVTVEELILLSYAFGVEPSDWFVGKGWAQLTPDARASLGVIRTMLAGSPTEQWTRINERMWDIPEFKSAPGIIGAQFEKLNERLRRAKEVLGPDATTETAIKAVEAAAGKAEVKAAHKLRVDPLDISLAAFRMWGRSLTQERDRRVSEAIRSVTLRSLQTTKGRVTRILLKELAPRLQQLRRHPEGQGT
ncbi:MAG: helix-turn-helix domain-containing protein [Actinomycetota bacterium]|nr:helix-turn-helix domain-containing protein [Actinomycetota bacterium]